MNIIFGVITLLPIVLVIINKHQYILVSQNVLLSLLGLSVFMIMPILLILYKSKVLNIICGLLSSFNLNLFKIFRTEILYQDIVLDIKVFIIKRIYTIEEKIEILQKYLGTPLNQEHISLCYNASSIEGLYKIADNLSRPINIPVNYIIPTIIISVLLLGVFILLQQNWMQKFDGIELHRQNTIAVDTENQMSVISTILEASAQAMHNQNKLNKVNAEVSLNSQQILNSLNESQFRLNSQSFNENINLADLIRIFISVF